MARLGSAGPSAVPRQSNEVATALVTGEPHVVDVGYARAPHRRVGGTGCRRVAAGPPTVVRGYRALRSRQRRRRTTPRNSASNVVNVEPHDLASLRQRVVGRENLRHHLTYQPYGIRELEPITPMRVQ